MKFLNYKDVQIHFVYSFSWDLTKAKFDDLISNLKVTESSDEFKINAWHKLKLHHRPLSWKTEHQGAYYQPNLISNKLYTLHRSGIIDENAEIYVPYELKNGTVKDLKKCKILSLRIEYNIRLFESGAGTCTFTIYLSQLNKITFEDINHVIHLAQNVQQIANSNHATNSFLLNKRVISNKNNTLFSEFYPKHADCNNLISLNDLFSKILMDPPRWFPKGWRSKNLWFDKRILGNTEKIYNWQSPYVFTVAEIEEKDFQTLIDKPKDDTIKEIATIAGKLTLENSKVKEDFKYLKREYIANTFGYFKDFKRNKDEADTIGLRNFSHHKKLFYTISKRGGIALSSDFSQNPGYFVIPSLINVIEILRTRWHLGNIVNISLDDAIQKAALSDKLDVVLNDIFKCRALFALFLQDPVPYLFDGGAITELAEFAEKEFWLIKLRDDTYRKFQALDYLINDYYNRQRFIVHNKRKHVLS